MGKRPGAGTPGSVLATGFLQLLVSQFFLRLIGFAMNMLIARHLSPEAYGLGSVQFHLITTSIMLLSREGFRRGCMRFGEGGSGDRSKLVRDVLSVAWLPIPMGLLVALAVSASVLLPQWGRPGAEAAEYRVAVMMVAGAAFLELLAEPFYILAAAQLHYRLRFAVDSAATVLKGLLTLGLVLRTSMSPAIVFALANLAWSATAFLGYAAYGLVALAQAYRNPPAQAQRSGGRQAAGTASKRQGRGEDEGKDRAASWAAQGWLAWSPQQAEVLWLCGLFSVQSGQKLLLGEGSKFVVATLQVT